MVNSRWNRLLEEPNIQFCFLERQIVSLREGGRVDAQSDLGFAVSRVDVSCAQNGKGAVIALHGVGKVLVKGPTYLPEADDTRVDASIDYEIVLIYFQEVVSARNKVIDVGI